MFNYLNNTRREAIRHFRNKKKEYLKAKIEDLISAFEDKLAIEKRKSHKSPGTDQIPAEMIKAGGRTIRHEIHKLIISAGNMEELAE